MRDKIEEIIAKTAPKLKFQLTVLEKVEDWVAYISNLQLQGFKVSGFAWRLSWGERLYYIVSMYLGPADHAVDIMVRVLVRVEDKKQKELAEYYIQNVLRTLIRDKMLDESINDIINNALMRWW
jgi:hypothetical protein